MYVRWNHCSYYTGDWQLQCRLAHVSPNAVFRALKATINGTTYYKVLTDKGLRLFTCTLEHLEVVDYGPKKELKEYF